MTSARYLKNVYTSLGSWSNYVDSESGQHCCLVEQKPARGKQDVTEQSQLRYVVCARTSTCPVWHGTAVSTETWVLCALEPQPVLCDMAEQSQLRHVACAPTSTCPVWSKEWMQLAINSDDLSWFQAISLEVMWVSKDFDVFTFFGPSRHPIRSCVDSCEECLSRHTYIVASVSFRLHISLWTTYGWCRVSHE